MRHAWNIVRKELDKIFKNPRLIFSTLIMPGLIIFVIYSVMGSSIEGQMNEVVEHTSQINVVYEDESLDQPSSFTEAVNAYNANENLADLNANFIPSTLEDKETIDASINNQEVDGWVIFESNFDQKMADFKSGLIENPPLVTLYFSESIMNSSAARGKVDDLLDIMENSLNPDIIARYAPPVLDETGSSSTFSFAMLLPMFITIFVFAGGLSIGSDAIAGEKERGTIATLLMSPIHKGQIVVGKIISTLILSILSALGSFIGTIASFSKVSSMYGAMELSYSLPTYLQTFVIILLLALMASSLFLIASTYAKSTKEATMYAMPVYIFAMILAFVPMFNSQLPTDFSPYLIPIYNLILGLKGIFMMKIQVWQFLLIIGTTLVYAVILLSIVRRLFQSERLMFQK